MAANLAARSWTSLVRRFSTNGTSLANHKYGHFKKGTQ
jgi:hypothetical protein